MHDEVDSRWGEDRRKPATPQKPSLSASFLEQKRRLIEQGGGEAARPHTADSCRVEERGGVDQEAAAAAQSKR